MTSDFLLELRSEEIPARMQAGARADLEKLFRKAMDEAGVGLGEVTVWSTPRRLALIARDLPAATAAVSEEIKGPRVGAPPQALEGFLRKTGLAETDLVERDGVLFAVIDKPGRPIKEVLAERLPLIVWQFPWPKSMRWGDKSISTESLKWVRPLSGIVTILGNETLEIDFSVAHVFANQKGDLSIVPGQANLISGNKTRGHRFHSDGEIEIAGADDYAAKLRAAHVIVDHQERQDLIREAAAAAAHAEGLVLVADEGLVIENAGLTEWPVPLLGRFDEAFLDVPPEVIQLTARTNQKYFICREPAGEGEEQGRLANAFVCTANIVELDGGAQIVAGNRKVLAARLSDARFFWEQDQKKRLSDHAEKLSRITFHEKLGTVADKVERVAKLASSLVDDWFYPGAMSDDAELAARLCKADLVTEMVGEFPELQGLMGGYYARAEGLPDAVADAIRDHYKPIGQGDEVPTAPVTVAVSLADKLDTLISFFAIGDQPTGSRDPYALRRAALGCLSLIGDRDIRLNLLPLIENFRDHLANQAVKKQYIEVARILGRSVSDLVDEFGGLGIDPNSGKVRVHGGMLGREKTVVEVDASPELLRQMDIERGVRSFDPAILLAFFADRLKVQQREAGVRHDLIDAVFALGGEDDLVRLLARVHALQAFVGTEDGTNLLAGYKRAANILKKEGVEAAAQIALSYTPETAEKALIDALDAAGPKASAAVEQEDFAAAMAALASLRAPIDAFFDQVTVNDADPAKRQFRLDLLARFRAAVHGVADFSRIEG